MKTFEIWIEGYAFNESEHGPCRLLGTSTGETFREACDKFFEENPSKEGKKYYNSEYGYYWACRLFDNREDAARFNG